VHIQQALGDLFTGFHNEGFIADAVCPILLVEKMQDKFWQAPLANTYDEADFTAPMGHNAGYNEINPTFTQNSYNCVEYALGAFLPTQLEQNADAVLDLSMQYGRLLADRFLKREEVAVATKLQDSANYDSALVVDYSATAAKQWLDGTGVPGAQSDPVKDMQDLMLKSVLPVTHAIMNERVYNAFMRHPKVQAYTQFKDGYAPFVAPDQLWATLNLPIPVLAKAKKNPASGSALPDYIWSSNHVSLIHKYDPSRVRSGTDSANMVRVRWKAGYQRIPGATVVNGMASRMFFNEYRGFAGGTQMIMFLAQDEYILEKKCGGIIKGVVALG
jgi:hypothetical protein